MVCAGMAAGWTGTGGTWAVLEGMPSISYWARWPTGAGGLVGGGGQGQGGGNFGGLQAGTGHARRLRRDGASSTSDKSMGSKGGSWGSRSGWHDRRGRLCGGLAAHQHGAPASSSQSLDTFG